MRKILVLFFIALVLGSNCTQRNIDCKNEKLDIYSIPWNISFFKGITIGTIKQISQTLKTSIIDSIPKCDTNNLEPAPKNYEQIDVRILLEYWCNDNKKMVIGINTTRQLMSINNKIYLTPKPFLKEIVKLLPAEHRKIYQDTLK